MIITIFLAAKQKLLNLNNAVGAVMDGVVQFLIISDNICFNKI